MQKQVMPPLKWAGGKRWLVPTIKAIYSGLNNTPDRLVEPFVGGMAIALGLMPKAALLNDANVHLINFYEHLKTGLEYDLPYGLDKDHFYAAREAFNALILKGQFNSAHSAKLFYYLIRTGFNGLCRFNNSGLFNVPFGKYKSINYQKDLKHYQHYMQNWQFSKGDFSELPIASGDFLYLDPPYDVEFTKYSVDDFTWQDQERMIRWLAVFDNPIIISNQATSRIIELYQDFGYALFVIDAPRSISCNGDRQKAKEVLAFNNISSELFDSVRLSQKALVKL